MDDVAAVAAAVAGDDRPSALRQPPPLSARWAAAPRQNSAASAARAKNANANRTSAGGWSSASVNAATATVATTATASGARTSLHSDPALTRRQASSGPIPVNRTSTIASGAVYWSNHGEPSDDFSPVNASEISGKKVPQKITTREPDQEQVVDQEDRLARGQRLDPPLGAQVVEARDDQRRRADDHDRDQAEQRRADGRGAEGVDRLQDPRADQEGAEQREREGRDDQRHVPDLQHPRFSWTITECRKAVPTSHGISEAFSTASQPQ